MLYLTLRHYEYVTAVGREGSLSAAVEALNVSQPALSVALNRIEAQLGYPLFLRRRGAAMTPTPQGRSFVGRAEALLAQAAQLENPDTPLPAARRLTLGCFVDLAPFLLAPALRHLRAVLPSVTIAYRVEPFEALISGMIKGQIDIALSYELGLDSGFDRRRLFTARPHAILAPDHPLAGRATLTLSALSETPLILSEEGLSAQHMLTLFRRQGLSPLVAHRAASLENLRSLAAHGEGVGISYAAPPAGTSYDGRPLVTLPIVDREAEEAVILTRHGTGPAEPSCAAAMRELAALLRAG